MNVLIINSLLCILALYNTSDIHQDEWKTVREENGVKISYRWVTSPKGKKAREMKAEFILNTDIPTVIAQFRNARNLIQWSVAAETCEIYPEADNTWETYICFDFPWPLRSRDLITQNELRVSGDTTVILMNSIPQSRPKVTGNKRISSYQAIWRFTPVSKKRIRVVHMVVTYDPPEFPRVLADPIIQNKFITSVERLRQQI